MPFNLAGLDICVILWLTLPASNTLPFEDKYHQRYQKHHVNRGQRSERCIKAYALAEGKSIEADIECEY